MADLRNLILFTLLLISTVASASYSDYRPLRTDFCLDIYSPQKKVRRQWILPGSRAIGNANEPKYSPTGRVVDISKNTKVTNQCDTFECYLFSVINFINVYNKTRLGARSALLSEPYLVAHKFLEHIKEGLLLGIDHPQLIHDLEGGFSYEAFHLTRTVGLVPKRSWQPKIPFENWDMAKVYRVLRKKVPQYHENLKKLAKVKGWQSPEVQQAQLGYFNELKTLITDLSGPLPTKFYFNGKEYSPITWEKEFGLPRLSMFEIHNKTGNDLPQNYSSVLRELMTKHGGHYRVLEGNYNSLVLSAKDYIDNGLPVIIDLFWGRDGHSMLIVGYEENDFGKISRFKVMNSWGKDFANNGFAWYTVEDIWKNISGSYRIAN